MSCDLVVLGILGVLNTDAYVLLAVSFRLVIIYWILIIYSCNMVRGSVDVATKEMEALCIGQNQETKVGVLH